MSAILPFVKIDSESLLARYFTRYQICWIEAEDPFHAAKTPVFALAEKSVRIGWTLCDGFKNVRKRLRFPKRDYLFVTRDLPSALEYMNQVYDFADMLGFTRAVLTRGEDYVKVKSLDPEGRPTRLTEEIKIGYIKFQNGSRIIAFSSNPYAMSVYGGDVGLDEFAKHPNAKLLWETAQGRVTWGYDLAVWSSHDGEDTLFHQFAQQARSSCSTLSETSSETLSSSPSSSTSSSINSQPSTPHPHPGYCARCHNLLPFFLPTGERSREHCDCGAALPENRPGDPEYQSSIEPPASAVEPAPPIENQNSKFKNPQSPWNLYFKVTMPDAVELGLLKVMNRTKGTSFTPEKFIADCRSRSGSEEVYEQSYLCNPLGAATASIVDWSAIERCRYEYQFERLHLESAQILQHFGQFNPAAEETRQRQIQNFIRDKFPSLFLSPDTRHSSRPFRLGFDVAASGEGDLAAIYIDEAKGSELWLRALFTCRTEDWHFLKTVLFTFLRGLKSVQGAGDESGLGRQICWEAASQFSSRFLKVNFAAKKQDLGFALMNQLSVAEKRFPRSEQDIAADFFAVRKFYTGTRWTFTEGRNTFNPASHCDIAWAAALATHAHTERRHSAGGMVC